MTDMLNNSDESDIIKTIKQHVLDCEITLSDHLECSANFISEKVDKTRLLISVVKSSDLLSDKEKYISLLSNYEALLAENLNVKNLQNLTKYRYGG